MYRLLFYSALFEKAVISEEEFDGYYFEYTKAGNQLASFIDNQTGISIQVGLPFTGLIINKRC
jgi:hypothetical protein